MGTKASHKSVLSGITREPELEPRRRPPRELTAEHRAAPTGTRASRGRDRKRCRPLTASAFASPDVQPRASASIYTKFRSRHDSPPWEAGSGSHLRWSPSGPPTEEGAETGEGHRGLQGLRLLESTSPLAR